MTYSDQDTIAAIATAPGEGSIGIVRVSGSEALSIADRLFVCPPPLPSRREAYTFVHGYIRECGGESRIDEAILLIYRAPASYTTEDVVEFQCHGGLVTPQRMLRMVIGAGARLAEPGEFTKRAFLNGRMDLLQAESVMDMIRARSERAATAALEQLEGKLSHSFDAIYDHVMELAADIEATLDFSEDELPDRFIDSLRERLVTSKQALQRLLESWDEGRLLRQGARVVIAGQPNAGKSTLLNALVGHERAIVADFPGTTRDTIEESILINGFPVHLIDTAGIRESSCSIEREGIARARGWIDRADVTIWVLDLTQPIDKQILAEYESDSSILVLNKMDLVHELPAIGGPDVVTIAASLCNGDGVEEIRAALVAQLGLMGDTSRHATISERHRMILIDTIQELTQGERLLASNDPEHMVPLAGHIRDALDTLGTATGRSYSEGLLDSIFSRFCVGK